ncbi:UbiD family decarboxylase [Effusibacillus dendaii]|uniref:Uncharacterized protein n=1 Tax=Effusibacillus dendaii TaxID=2743772 RepID=A0A7I8DE50_9BACL|nr:UbiD family decarboxylase [Effusibacillus dendaii]BCJ88385.1 hypothetical protein skT53_33700 [Effusibacillus dendaii]
MTHKSLSAVAVAEKTTELREFDIPAIPSHAGLLKVEIVGVCGTDVSYYKMVKEPRILGHHVVGHIEQIGEEAANRWGVKEGDRVAMEEYIPCGQCSHCRTGMYRACVFTDPRAGGIRYGAAPISIPPSLWGGFSQYMFKRKRENLFNSWRSGDTVMAAGEPVFAIRYCPAFGHSLQDPKSFWNEFWVSRDPLDPDHFGKQNVGIYRLQVQGPDRLSLMTIPSHDMGKQIMLAEKHGTPFKIAIMLGNHPAITLFAGTPLGYAESEYAYAAAMMGDSIELTQSGNGLDILANSEMVIEAELVHGERILEGPFGEFPGSYSGVRRAPVFCVTAVSHRKNPIFENIYIGKGWTEHDTLIGLHTSVPIYSQLRETFPEVVAVNALYQHGLTGIISVKNRFGGFAKSVALRALGTPHGVMYLKNLIMVDEDVDPFDLNQVMWALSTRTRANDIMVLPNMPLVPVDPSAEVSGKGHRLIIDATSFAPPDTTGHDARIVSPPSGPEIDRLVKQIRSLQEGIR